MKTKKEYLKAIAAYEELDDAIWEIFGKIKDRGLFDAAGDINYWELSDNDIFIHWSETWGYGGCDNGTVYISTDWLWSDVDEILDAVKREKDEKKAAIEKMIEESLIEKERGQYEKLKAKFEK